MWFMLRDIDEHVMKVFKLLISTSLLSGVSNLALRIDASQDVIRVGDTVDIRCSASGDIPVTFSWSKVGERLEDNVQLAGNLLR
jgi:hypothetical protein